MTLDLTQQEVSQILQTLANIRYIDVYQLIHKINEQARAQMNIDKTYADNPSEVL